VARVRPPRPNARPRVVPSASSRLPCAPSGTQLRAGLAAPARARNPSGVDSRASSPRSSLPSRARHQPLTSPRRWCSRSAPTGRPQSSSANGRSRRENGVKRRSTLRNAAPIPARPGRPGSRPRSTRSRAPRRPRRRGRRARTACCDRTQKPLPPRRSASRRRRAWIPAIRAGVTLAREQPPDAKRATAHSHEAIDGTARDDARVGVVAAAVAHAGEAHGEAPGVDAGEREERLRGDAHGCRSRRRQASRPRRAPASPPRAQALPGRSRRAAPRAAGRRRPSRTAPARTTTSRRASTRSPAWRDCGGSG